MKKLRITFEVEVPDDFDEAAKKFRDTQTPLHEVAVHAVQQHVECVMSMCKHLLTKKETRRGKKA